MTRTKVIGPSDPAVGDHQAARAAHDGDPSATSAASWSGRSQALRGTSSAWPALARATRRQPRSDDLLPPPPRRRQLGDPSCEAGTQVRRGAGGDLEELELKKNSGQEAR